MKKRKRIEALEQRVGGVLNVEAHEKSHLRRINDLEVEVHLLMHFREEALRRIDALEAAPSADPAVARAQNELGQMLIDKTLAEKGHPGRSCAEAQERIRELLMRYVDDMDDVDEALMDRLRANDPPGYEPLGVVSKTKGFDEEEP